MVKSNIFLTAIDKYLKYLSERLGKIFHLIKNIKYYSMKLIEFIMLPCAASVTVTVIKKMLNSLKCYQSSMQGQKTNMNTKLPEQNVNSMCVMLCYTLVMTHIFSDTLCLCYCLDAPLKGRVFWGMWWVGNVLCVVLQCRRLEGHNWSWLWHFPTMDKLYSNPRSTLD